ncbi:hypothetical protein Tco_0538464 [Tanacetum coccineum]
MDIFISLPEKLRVSYVIKAFNANYESITNAAINAVTEDNAREKMASEKLKEVIVEIMKLNLTNEDIFKAADMFAAESKLELYAFYDIVCDRSFLCFLFDDSPTVPVLLTDLEDFDSKIDEPNELSSPALKETGPPFCDGLRGCLIVASRWRGGNFSLLHLAFD